MRELLWMRGGAWEQTIALCNMWNGESKPIVNPYTRRRKRQGIPVAVADLKEIWGKVKCG